MYGYTGVHEKGNQLILQKFKVPVKVSQSCKRFSIDSITYAFYSTHYKDVIYCRTENDECKEYTCYTKIKGIQNINAKYIIVRKGKIETVFST